jgi:hypothetical protein
MWFLRTQEAAVSACGIIDLEPSFRLPFWHTTCFLQLPTSRIISGAATSQRKEQADGKLHNDSQTCRQRSKQDSHLFFVLGLGYSLDSSPEDKFAGKFSPQKPPAVVSTINRLSARVRPVLLIENEEGTRSDVWYWSGYGRLVIEVWKSDAPASAARRLTDGLHSLMAVIGELPAPFEFVPYEIPQTIVKNGRITWKELESVEGHFNKKRTNVYSDLLGFEKSIRDAIYISGRRLAHIFFHLPTLVRLDSLFDAAHFYQEAVRDFQFAGDDVREILAEPEARPETGTDRVALESATLNSFRAVEAIVGEPGKENRFRNHLLAAGINADETVGYAGDPEWKISERIRWLQDLRDKTSGHGRRSRSDPLRYREAMEAQDLAKAVVVRALIHHTSLAGRVDGEPAEKRFLLNQMFGRRAMYRLRRKSANTAPEILVEQPGGFQQLISALAE